MEFALKRFRQSHRSEEIIFRSLIAENWVLGHPSIYEHSNILRLEGVCWGVPPDEKVWPVLVKIWVLSLISATRAPPFLCALCKLSTDGGKRM